MTIPLARWQWNVQQDAAPYAATIYGCTWVSMLYAVDRGLWRAGVLRCRDSILLWWTNALTGHRVNTTGFVETVDSSDHLVCHDDQCKVNHVHRAQKPSILGDGSQLFSDKYSGHNVSAAERIRAQAEVIHALLTPGVYHPSPAHQLQAR